MVTIGIFGPQDDAEVRALADHLRNRGVEPWIVDLAGLPDRLRITLKNKDILVDERPLEDMAAAYLRKLGRTLPSYLQYDVPPPEDTLEEWSARYAEARAHLQAQRHCQVLRVSIVGALARARTVVNPPDMQSLHRQKVRLFATLRKQGVPVPEFVAGVAPGPMAAFADSAGGRWDGVVEKPLAGIYKTRLLREKTGEGRSLNEGGAGILRSGELSEITGSSRKETIGGSSDVEAIGTTPEKNCPALYQRYIRGDTIRCYVLEGRVLSAARIVHGGTVDSSISQTGIEPVMLPPQAEVAAEATARALDLAFCGIDLMHPLETDRYYVIDCNLSPMFVNYSRLSRHDITAHLADFLIRSASRQVPYRRPRALDLLDRAKQLLADDPDIASLLTKR